jgi:integrase
MATVDPAGHRFGPAVYVFGDAVGRRLKSPKKAWATTVLKAHGHTPIWVKSDLSPASREAYGAINLKFHDLRHEAGSRWLEAGIPLHHVKQLLGHASISTTDTYLNTSRIHLHESMARLDWAIKNDTNVPQKTPEVEAQRLYGEDRSAGKLLLH